MTKLLWILSILVILAFSGYAATAMSNNVDLVLGHKTFTIPKQYSAEGSIPMWLRKLSGLDDGSREILLYFSAEEIARNVPGYEAIVGRIKQDMTVTLAVLTPVEVGRYKNPSRHSDLWYGRDSYKNRIVKEYKEMPWFKVFRKVEYPYSWAVLKQYPDKSKRLPDNVFSFWIAQCLKGNSLLTESGKYTSCSSYVFFDDIAVDFDVSEENLDVIDKVRSFLESKVKSWEKH